MSDDIDPRKMEAFCAVFAGGFFTTAGAISVCEPLAFGRYYILAIGVAMVVVGIRNYLRILRETK